MAENSIQSMIADTHHPLIEHPVEGGTPSKTRDIVTIQRLQGFYEF